MDKLNEKELLRRKYINIRNKIDDKDNKSQLIVDNLIKDKDFINAKIIALYKSLNNEVNTNELISYCFKLKKIILLPKVIGDDLVFYKINENEIFIKSSFGVLEPIGKEINKVNKKEIDLVIVPGVCFDENKNRLGFGKGYYDRFLNNINLKTIALCYEEQVLKERILPVESNDVKINKILTDKRTI